MYFVIVFLKEEDISNNFQQQKKKKEKKAISMLCIYKIKIKKYNFQLKMYFIII